nr:hypothetical transcript [Hymenolepis microstoma]
MIIQGQSQHRIDDQHQRRSSKVMSQPHDLPTMRLGVTETYPLVSHKARVLAERIDYGPARLCGFEARTDNLV